jgi:YHS domain-containing protein
MKTLVVLLTVLFLSACGHRYAVMPNSDGDSVMLLGHDPVSYFTQGKPVRGDPAIRASHDGVVFYFANQENQQAFTAKPDQYFPQYGGFCASGAAYALKLGSDPTEFVIRDGRIFFFGDVLGKTAWQINPEWNVEKGDEVWPAAKDTGWRWQSLKRFASKVSWYKDSATIRREYKEKFPDTPRPEYDPGGLMQNLFFKSPGWRAREGFGHPVVGFVGEDPCPVACPATVSKAFGE